MDAQTVAETLPERYRAVLDRIADLEACGRRHDADEIRRQAIRAYSRAWTSRTARTLDSLAHRASTLAAAAPRDRRHRSRLSLGRVPRRQVVRLGGVPATNSPTVAPAGDGPPA
ncbi:MAG TPA: hypothetical protein VFW86_00695 [Candidatus Limnocylindrales bacterium]|nr:hypothetical protein [Candidatus Limnocylindrales bacterium]